MLTYIKRKLNKTITENTSNLIQRIEQIDENTIISLLSSHLLGEGIGIFEIVSNEDFTDHYLITPSFLRLPVGEETLYTPDYLKDDIKHLHCYSITLLKPSFMPLYTEESLSIIQSISLLTFPHTDVHMQLLFTRRNDSWKDDLINQYEQYLLGNDNPALSKSSRKFQGKLIKLIDKMSGFDSKRDPINEIEQKILDTGYRFELRLIVSTKHKDKYENELRDILKEMDFFNELVVQEIHKSEKKEFVDDFVGRRLSKYSQDITISEAEIMCMLGDKGIEIKKPSLEYKEVKSVNVMTKSYSKLIDLLPKGEKKERQIDYTVANKIGDSLERTRITKTNKINIVKVEQGATLQKITIEIPNNINFSDIKKKYEDLQVALGVKSFSVEQGDKPDTVAFTMPLDEREIVYLKDLLSDERFIEFASKHPLPFIVGIDTSGNPIYECLSRTRHLLFAGQTGGGKSAWLNAVLITFILFKEPDEIRLFLIDPKKVELSQYKGFPHVEKVITDMSEAYDLIESLLVEMDKRYEFLEKVRYKDIASYNKHNPKNKKPFIVCVIDEFKSLKSQYKEVDDIIQRLGGEARAAGIHLLIGTQYPIKEAISSIIKENLPSAISFKLKSNKSYEAVFGTGIPYNNLLGMGDGVAKLEGHKEEFIRFQGAIITPNQKEEQEVIDKLKDAFKNGNYKTEQIELEEIVQEEPIDKLKRIIVNTGELRIKPLQVEMNIRINIVQELMYQLVEEGFLEKDGRSYKVVASEEELAKWRSQ